MIILDMDGTLLNSDNVILESSKTVLQKLKETGKIIVIATGRCLPNAINYFDESFADYILSNNGAVWYQINSKQIIRENCLDVEKCIAILNAYSNSISKLYLTDSTLHEFCNVEDAIHYINNHNNIYCVSIHLNDYRECAKTVEKLRDMNDDLYIELMQDSFDEYQWIGIFGKGNNKGTNIKEIIEYLNVDFNNSICFGDGLNDVEMFKQVKTAVAMGNALPEVKALATYITDTNDNHGISKFLYDYFFENKGQGE